MRRPGVRMQNAVLQQVVSRAAIVGGLVLITLPSMTAQAGPLCVKAMFTCQTMNETTDGQKVRVDHGKNLRQLIVEEQKSLTWVRKHCSLITRDPFECDWKRTIRTRSIGTSTARRPPPAARAPTGKTARARIPAVVRRAVRHSPSVSPAPIRAPIKAAQKRPFHEHVQAAAARYKLPVDLISAVMTVESGGNPKAVSHVGAQGLMQLMPDTARAMGVVDPWDAGQSIMGGARFLRVLANRFNGDLVKVLSAYHAGSTRVKKRGGTPFSATDRYVRKVLRVYYALRDG